MFLTFLLYCLLPFQCLTALPLETKTSTKTTEVPSVVFEQTFSILKPDAVEQNLIGEILEHYESAGLKRVSVK